jgi:hypothetical protein
MTATTIEAQATGMATTATTIEAGATGMATTAMATRAANAKAIQAPLPSRARCCS